MKVSFRVPFRLAFPMLVAVSAALGAEPDGPRLTLEECLRRSLDESPRLRAAAPELRALEAEIEQAGLSPNPGLEVEAENIFGTGAFQTVEGIEATVLIRQTIETAGKREKRAAAAAMERDVGTWEYLRGLNAVLHETASAFTALAAAEKRVELLGEFYGIGRAIHETIKTTVEAGRESPLEETRARLELASTRIELERGESERRRAMLRLAGLWGLGEPDFSGVDMDFEALPEPPAWDALAEALPGTPDAGKARGEIGRREAVLALERARAVPDVSVGAGIRYLSDNEDAAFTLGVSVPLPLFDRNQGAIRAASERAEQARLEREALLAELRAELAGVYETALQARTQAVRLRDEILPAALEAFESAREGFRYGKFPYIDVLDAQRTLFENRILWTRALEDYHQSLIEINRLTAGFPIDTHEFGGPKDEESDQPDTQ